jgi:uncharacterized protein (DUF58 family)
MIAPGWQPTVSQVRAVTVALVFSIVGALVRRPDLVVLAAPLVTIAVWGAARRPSSEPTVVQRVDHTVLREGEASRWHVTVRFAADAGVGGEPSAAGRRTSVEDVGVALWAPPFTQLDPPWGESVAVSTGDSSSHSVTAFRSTRWGRRPLGPARVVVSSAWAAFRWTNDLDEPRQIVTLPLPAVFDAEAPAPPAVGLVGHDRSVRPGDGSEFAGIRSFHAGDRLRRIHWPRSLRTGELHVTATWADHDRHVLLVVDASSDVGDSDGIDGRSSSLDTTVRAAGALAEHHLRRGDRVALQVHGARGIERVPPAAGVRHLRRVLDALAAIEPATSPRDDLRAHLGLTDGTLVVMLSPLVTDRALRRAVTLAGRGIAVVVIDTLPDGVTDHDPSDPFRALAWRIRLLERARELRAVQAAGVPVVRWRGPGSLDQVLRDVARRRSAPRVVRR